MRNLMLLAGVAALAVAMPAFAKENDRGRGNGRGGPAAAAHNKGQGHGRAERARGRDQARAQARPRGGERRAERLDRRERRVERAIQQDRRQVRQARAQEQRADRRQERRLAERRVRNIREVRREDGRDWRRWAERRAVLRERPVFADRRDTRARRVAVRGDRCPPGLARQNRWCMPPGQLRKARLMGQRLPLARVAYNIPDRYRYRFTDNDRWFYRYADDGFVYRLDRRTMIVNNIIPLYGSNLMIGEPMPLGYDSYNLPLAYRSYYPDTSEYHYRYDDGAIYQVDAETRLVEGIVALLTGGAGGLGGLGVGDALPSGYDAYNVPFDYRDQYADSSASWYRYADGAIYQVDPQTRLIESIISTLV